MKKIICTALASLMLLYVSACSTIPHDSSVAVTSSAASQILTDRLGKIPENVVLGDSAVASEYGINMDGFEDDGYVIRTVGDDTVIFGKTEDALERAVRKYSNAVLNGDDISNVTYHEGYRVEKLEIFGVDVSEYVIVYGNEPDSNMKFAASELQKLVKKACGAELTVSEIDADAPHKIIFRHSDDAELEDAGYRYFAEDGNLVIEGAVNRGCVFGVYRFLQNECGWDQLTGGDSFLQESDYINIPEDINKSEIPAFNYLNVYTQHWGSGFKTDRTPRSFPSISGAGHGIASYLEDTNAMADQPCFTSEEVFETVRDNVETFIKGRLAAGAVIGVNFFDIDLSQNDSSKYCLCNECVHVLREEGGVNSGAVIRFANRLSEEMNETYPGLAYKVFAYGGSNSPCKTAPNEHVYITYCFDGVCSNHPLDGKSCNGGKNGYGRKSEDYARWFEAWTEKTENIFVWFYALDTNFHDYTTVDTIYHDFRYLDEHNVKGIFYEAEFYGLGTKRVEHQLVHELNWNIDMTEEEYYALYKRLMEKEYGPGWEYVVEYMEGVNKAQDMKQCWHSWGYSWPDFRCDAYYDTFFYGENYDYFVEIMDRAIAMAETDAEIQRCELLMIGTLYKGCFSLYFEAYENDDEELMAKLSERFDRAMALMRKYGFKMENGTGEYNTITVCYFKYESIHDAAWIDWYSTWDILYPSHKKPIPDKYAGTCTSRSCGGAETTIDILPNGNVKCTRCFYATIPGSGVNPRVR